MFITVAPDASPGDYYHDVRAEGKAFGITVEKTVYTDVLTTVIPEFSTIAIPAAAIHKEKKSLEFALKQSNNIIQIFIKMETVDFQYESRFPLVNA